ncbi:MAG: hypothetical protein QM757_33705 [Paludibaculum sp.]
MRIAFEVSDTVIGTLQEQQATIFRVVPHATAPFPVPLCGN